jgi:RsiW-degrading membrane proteinase PrsW (M82 family)
MVNAKLDRSRGGLVLRGVCVLVLIGALCLACGGVLVSAAVVLINALDPAGDLLMATTLAASLLALTVGMGLALAWQAWQAIQGRGSGPFRPRGTWALVLALVLVLICGQLVLVLELVPALTFPLFHVAGAVLPPLIVLALVGMGLAGATRRRDMVLQTGSGSLLSTFLAFTLEGILVLGVLLMILVVAAMQPGGLYLIQELAGRLQTPTWLEDAGNLESLIRSPIVLAGAFLVAAVLIPLVEESVKTVGVGLFAYRRPNASQAFLWGVAGGAGFALTEGLLNSVGALDLWAPVVLARGGATLVHCFTGGLMGLAWYSVLAQRRWGRAAGLYASSVAIHGLWNGLAIAMTVLFLGSSESTVPTIGQMLTNLGVLAVLTMLAGLVLATGLGLAGLVYYVRNREPAPRVSEPSTNLPQGTGPFPKTEVHEEA